MKKILVICGPTATGKTALAVKLAKSVFGGNSELISADSRQVYKGMDIGTGKDHPRKIRIHLIDVVSPDQEFSVSQYYRLAWRAIKKIWRAGKLPILVGGTGFYIKAVIDGVETKDIPPNQILRQGSKTWTAARLYRYLEDLDPIKAASLNKSDRSNPRRLVRAIEIVAWKKENPQWQGEMPPPADILLVGLKAGYSQLYQKIDRRVFERLKKGVEKEVKSLIDKGFSWDLPAMNSLGYAQWRSFFDGKSNKEEVIRKWQFAEHGYARRQMTWFKKALRITQGKTHWFDISQKKWQEEVENLVRGWYDKKRNAAKN